MFMDPTGKVRKETTGFGEIVKSAEVKQDKRIQ